MDRLLQRALEPGEIVRERTPQRAPRDAVFAVRAAERFADFAR